MSIVFIKIYVEIWIIGMSIMWSQKFTFKNQVKNQIATVDNFLLLPGVCSSHEQLLEQFTVVPCKAGMCIHCTKNYQGSYEAIKKKAQLYEATEIDREERLRRQREQYRVRRLRETVKERGQIGQMKGI